MRGYDVPAGTKALLLENPTAGDKDCNCKWTTRNFTTTKDRLFVDDEMIVDPTRVFNGGSGVDPNGTAYKLAERGYVVFTNNPNKRQRYLLAVPFASVTIG